MALFVISNEPKSAPDTDYIIRAEGWDYILA